MGKGGGGGGQTTSTVTNTNIPEYARGYVENMLGATQHQLFNTTTNPTTGETELGSLRPYQAYGGTYDSSGNMTSYDPSKAIAGFTPMQQMAQNGIYNLQMPGQFYAASEYTADAMQRAANAGYNPGQFTMGQAQAPDVNYYQMNQPRDVTGQQSAGVQLGSAPQAQAAQMQAAQLGSAPIYGAAQLAYNPQDVGYERVTAPNQGDFRMQAAGNVRTGSFARPGAADAYMSPYIQNVVDIQQREAQRQADIASSKRRVGLANAGAFGGGRHAIENAEAARNLAIQKGDIQALGLQSAFQSAQGQFNTEQQARLQANLANQQVQQQTGVQNLGAALQTAQNRLTAQQLNQAAGIQTGQFNQQQRYNTALQNAQLAQQQQLANQALQGQYGLTQGQFNQAANAANQQSANQIALANQALTGQYGLTQGQFNQANNQFNAQQNQAANLANQQMAYNTGMQNLQANLGVQQLGAGQNMQAQLANQQAMLANQQAIEQSRQFGAGYGQQMNAQQLAAAQQLAGIGGQQLTAQQGIYGLQNQIGGQQQQQQQQIINQALQDYSNAQQYPLMQLGTMSNMLRGLPMQASTTNMYQAAPNALTQGIGAVGAYGALNNAFGGSTTTGRKEGGVIHAAKGGIMSYDVGGEIESTLEGMNVDSLKKYAKESSSPSVKKMAMRLIQEKSMPVPRMARGGILAFAKSTEENNQSLVEGEDAEKLRKYGGAPSYLYNPGEFLSKINPFRAMAERHAESFGTKLSAPPPAAAPAEPAPPPAALTNPSAITAVPTAGPAPAPVPRAAPAPAAPPVTAQTPPVARPPAGPAPTPAPAGISAASFPGRPDIPDTPEHVAYRTQAAAANANANKTVAQYLADVKAEQVAAGLEPENTGMKDYRARIMAERANLDDEAKRQKNLRLAEFFASWGSTPGATLVAGMTALKKTIPNLIEDEKERKKALREADKIIYDLDQAVRLEKKGDINAAADRKQNAAKIAEPYNATLARLAQDKNRDAIAAQGHEADFLAKNAATAASERSSRYTADANVRAAQIREQSASADRLANRQTADENKRFGQYQAAAEQERRALSRIATEENGDQYKADVRLLESGASSTNPTMIEMRKQAATRVKDRKEEWDTIRENAKRDTELAYRRLAIQGDTAPPRGGATAPPPGHTLAGYTPDGKPVYQDSKGNKFVGQ